MQAPSTIPQPLNARVEQIHSRVFFRFNDAKSRPVGCGCGVTTPITPAMVVQSEVKNLNNIPDSFWKA